MAKEQEKNHFMNHPVLTDLVGYSFDDMRRESDRGAVLIATEIITSVLNNVFDKLDTFFP